MVLLLAKEESRKSHIFNVPLFVPKRKRLSEVGWILEKLIVSFCSSIFSFQSKSTATKGRSPWAFTPVYTFCNFGILRSLPADFTTFLSVLSNIFQSLTVLELEVAIFRYFPWPLIHCRPTNSSYTSILRRGSNSLECDWNSVRYS